MNIFHVIGTLIILAPPRRASMAHSSTHLIGVRPIENAGVDVDVSMRDK